MLVRCRVGCSQDDVLDGLRARGLWPSSSSRVTRPTRPPAPLEEARERVLARARRRLPWELTIIYGVADQIRRQHRLVERVRALATQRGPDEIAWKALAGAARLETLTRALEEALG